MGTPSGDECVDLAVESSDDDIQETTLPVVGPSRPKRKGKAEILWYFTEVGSGVWVCLLCRDQKVDPLCNRLKRRKDGSMNIFWRHLECSHSRIYHEMKGTNLDQRTITEAYGHSGAVKKTLEKTKEIIAQFVCLTDSPWAIIGNVGFNIMWKYAAEMTIDPPGSKAIKDVTRKLFGNMKGKLVHLLADVPRVSLTVNAWIAENSCGLLGITVHWVNNWWELCERVHAIRELFGKHSGENMRAIVIQALEDFGLKTKVGSITTDNASSNRRMVGLLGKELKPINHRFAEDRHVPCAAHVLNIIIQAALQSLCVSVTTHPPKIADYITLDAANEPDYDADTDDLDATRETATSHAEMVCHDSGLVLGDVIARWNSTHDMLHAALEKREVIDFMVLQIMSVTDKDIEISREEWKMLADFRDILGPFYRTTKYVSGSKIVRVVEVIRILKALMRHIDKILLKFDMSTIFASGTRMTTAQIASIRKLVRA
ncbi:putative transcriptional regulator tpeD [Wolffia australiana]